MTITAAGPAFTVDGSNLTVTGTADTDTISVELTEDGKISIWMNSQNQIVEPDDLAKLEIFAGESNDSITLGEGIQELLAETDNIDFIVDAGGGDDEITNHVAGAVINGGEGADILDNYAHDVTFNGGLGVDALYSQDADRITYNAGQGDDIAEIVGGEDHDINGAAGQDTLGVKANNSSIDGGAGKDSIKADGVNNVIADGGHNNVIVENGQLRGTSTDFVFPEGLDIRDMLMFLLVLLMKYMRGEIEAKQQEIEDATNATDGSPTDKDIDVLVAELDDLVSDRNNLFDMLTASINMLQQTASAVAKMRNG